MRVIMGDDMAAAELGLREARSRSEQRTKKGAWVEKIDENEGIYKQIVPPVHYSERREEKKERD